LTGLTDLNTDVIIAIARPFPFYIPLIDNSLSVKSFLVDQNMLSNVYYMKQF